MKREWFKYISNRIKVLQGALLIAFLLMSFLQAILFFRRESPLWPLLLLIAVGTLYFVILLFWVDRPFYDSEIISKRFLEGYVMTDTLEFNKVYLTPTGKLQLEKIDEMQKSPHVMDLNKRQAQYLALQNQINPHFLYNTLESIRGEALIAGLDSVADMTEALAKFFRYTITKVENLVSVEEELDNCETYFLIQKYRFGDRLKLHIEVEEEDREDILNCKIPKLTLQPILENSIIHGTELKIGTGNLLIQFERTNTRLIIRISDDGVGMDEETVGKLNARLHHDNDTISRGEDSHGGIALVNVNNRIHLIFGEEYGMHIYSVPGKGTDVEINVPFVTSERELRGRGVLK